MPSSGDAFSPPTAVDEDMIEQGIDLKEPRLLPADDEEYCASLRKEFCYRKNPLEITPKHKEISSLSTVNARLSNSLQVLLCA